MLYSILLNLSIWFSFPKSGRVPIWITDHSTCDKCQMGNWHWPGSLGFHTSLMSHAGEKHSLPWHLRKKGCSAEKKASFSYLFTPLRVPFAFRRRLSVCETFVMPQGCNSSPFGEDGVPENEGWSRTTLDPGQQQHWWPIASLVGQKKRLLILRKSSGFGGVLPYAHVLHT